MAATLTDGWLCVPYTGPDAVLVEIGTSPGPGDAAWQPAFLDRHDGKRIAKVRPPADPGARLIVWLRVAGVVTNAGRYPTA